MGVRISMGNVLVIPNNPYSSNKPIVFIRCSKSDCTTFSGLNSTELDYGAKGYSILRPRQSNSAKLILGILTVVLSVFQLATAQTGAPDEQAIEGTVVDLEGNPIIGARVSIGEGRDGLNFRSTITDRD